MPPASPLPRVARPAAIVALLGGLLAAAAVSPASAQEAGTVADQLRRMTERMERLEQRNQALERQLKALQASAVAPTGGAGELRRLESVEREQAVLAQRVDDLGSAADAAASDAGESGPKIEASVAGVAQRVNAAGAADGRAATRAGYRGDLTAQVPAGTIGDAQASAFGHLRFGQGEGLGLRPTYTSTVDSLAFQTAAGPDDSFAIVAQAWVNLEWPLSGAGFNEQKGDRLELTLGKMDVFGFFDQNAVAGDEAAQFLNNAFVHNPLLDSGGDIAADAYGFAPGLRLAYTRVGDGSARWTASLGVFGAGSGANFSGGLGRPLTIAQVEWSTLQINGEPRGSYRLYAWTNGRTTGLDEQPQRHTGLGVSLDQRIGRDWHLFARAGRRSSGDGLFDRALTLGFEHGGRAWGRDSDALGVAVGALRTSAAWRGATADGTLIGHAASGSERLLEVYYRMKLNEHFELSPDFQLVQRPAGDGAASAAKVFGIRAVAKF